MNPNAPMIILSPLIDPDGVPMQGLAGEPLAADEQGIVYTLRDDGPPDVLGELASDEEGRLILIPMSGLGATAGEKAARIQAAKCRRVMARGRRRHWERRLQHLNKRIANGQAKGTLPPRELARLEREKQTATTKLEQAKAREASAESAFTSASNAPLSDDGEEMVGDYDDMAGLGRLRFKKKFLKRGALMAATGGAAAPFMAARRTKAGKRSFGRFLNDDGTDPMMAGDEMPVSTQVAGVGDIGSWWTKNREKVLGFGAGAASAALVASGTSKGSGLNTLLTTGWDAAKGFFVPKAQGAAPAPMPTAAAPAPIAMRAAMPVMRSAAPPMQMAQAGIAGIDGKTLLLIGGLGLGALVLLRPKR